MADRAAQTGASLHQQPEEQEAAEQQQGGCMDYGDDDDYGAGLWLLARMPASIALLLGKLQSKPAWR